MGAPIEYYVDPSLGSDTGDGSVGTPWGRASGSVIQYALDTGITRNATHGDRINVKAGSADTVSAAIDLTTYGTSTAAVPVIIQGYSTAADDGGQGEITAGGSNVSIFVSTGADGVWFVDMKMGNCGNQLVYRGDNNCGAIRCEIHTSTSTSAGVFIDSFGTVIGCYMHGLGGAGISCRDGYVHANYIDHGTNSGAAIDTNVNSVDVSCIGNICKLNNVGAQGILLTNANARGIWAFNSIYNAAAGTSSGIDLNGSPIVMNNLVEGFSGTGGVGIEIVAGSNEAIIVSGNGIFNCETDISGGGIHSQGNESLSASPFASTTTFQPADTDNVLEGAFPTTDISATITYSLDKGAVQLTPAGGGGGGAPGNMSGGLQ